MGEYCNGIHSGGWQNVEQNKISFPHSKKCSTGWRGPDEELKLEREGPSRRAEDVNKEFYFLPSSNVCTLFRRTQESIQNPR